MELIEIKTLIDISNTNVNRYSETKEKEFNQQKNFITLLQCIGLRSIIEYDQPPIQETIDLKEHGFGSKYKGKHKMWTFRFRPDRTGSFLIDDDGIGHLRNDLQLVPVIKNLTETINISKAVFDLEDSAWKNTIVTMLEIEDTTAEEL